MTRPTDALDLDETLARWRAEEAAVRARLQRAPGVASPDQIAGRSGMQIFQALLAGRIPPPPMAVALNFTLRSAKREAGWRRRRLVKASRSLALRKGGFQDPPAGPLRVIFQNVD